MVYNSISVSVNQKKTRWESSQLSYHLSTKYTLINFIKNFLLLLRSENWIWKLKCMYQFIWTYNSFNMYTAYYQSCFYLTGKFAIETNIWIVHIISVFIYNIIISLVMFIYNVYLWQQLNLLEQFSWYAENTCVYGTIVVAKKVCITFCPNHSSLTRDE